MAETNHTLGTFRSSDGYAWSYRNYESAASQPWARLVCLHGIQSHGGWYEYSCSRLSQAGVQVYFLDRRGSGINAPDRGDTPSGRRLLQDVAEFIQNLPAGSPGLFLLAISWGGKLALALERAHPGLVRGMALLCPGFFPRVRPPFRERCAIAWARLVAPRRLFPIPLSDPELFTATPRWQDFIRQDPLSLREATARLLVESVRLDRLIRSAPHWVRVPVLLMLAEKDRIIDNQRTRSFIESFASSDKQIIEYPGAHHTLEFEPEPDRFIEDLLRWLRSHTEQDG